MSAEIMSLFGPLSSQNIDQRITAASSIVAHLVPPAADDGLDDADFQYTIKRLIRGLASPTVGARLGFAVALTEILSKSNHASPQEVHRLLISSTATQSGMKPSEEKDLLLGRLFGIKAMVSSGLISKSSTSTTEPSFDLWSSLVDDLVSLSVKRPWLAESAGWVLTCGMLQSLLGSSSDSEPVPWKNKALERLIEKFFVSMKTWNLEKLAMAILLQQYEVSADWKIILGDTFSSHTILNQKNYEGLFNLLTSTTTASSGLGSSLPPSRSPGPAVEPSTRPHFIHSVIISSSKSGSTNFNISELYARLLEDYYFSPHESTPTRKAQGLNLLNDLLTSTDIPQTDKPNLLTPSTVYTLMVQLAGRDRLLHKMAQSVMDTMIEQAKGSGDTNSAHGFAVKIRNCVVDFDQRSKTKTLEDLLCSMAAQEVESWTLELINAMETGKIGNGGGDNMAEEEEVVDDKSRERILSSLCVVIRNQSIPKTTTCIRSILRLIISCGFFGIISSSQISKSSSDGKHANNKQDSIGEDDDNPTIDSPSSHSQFFEQCRSRFYTCLSELSCQPSNTVKLTSESNGQGGQSTLPKSKKEQNLSQRWTTEALEVILTHERAGHQTLINQTKPLDLKYLAELERLRKVGIMLRDRIDQSSDEFEKRQSLGMLCESILLMSFDDHEDLVEVLGLVERLDTGLQDILKRSTNQQSTKKLKKLTRQDPESASSIDVLMETLVYLLSWPIAFLRNVVEQVFVNFVDCIGVSSLQLLINQMIPSNSDLHSISDDEDEEMSEEGSAKDESSSDETSSDESEDDEDSESISGSSLGSVDEAFRDEVATALANALDKNTEGDDGSDVSEDLMDDQEMLALDTNLAALFQRRTGKAVTKAANMQDLHLRLKLSELLAKFVKLRPDPFLIARLITPMLNLIRKPAAGEEALNNKVSKILKDAFNQPKRKFTEELEKTTKENIISEDEWLKIFKRVFHVAQTVEEVEVSNICGKAMSWLIDLAQSYMPDLSLTDPTSKISSELCQLYGDSLREFCTRKNPKLHLKFFTELVNKHPLLGWNLRHALLDLSVDQGLVNTYRRNQVIGLIYGLLKAFYHRQSERNPSSQILEFMSSVQTYLIKILEQGINPDSAVTPTTKQMDSTRLKELLRFCSNLVDLSVQASSSTDVRVWEIWPAKELIRLSQLAQSRSDLSSSKAVTDLFKKIVGTLDPDRVQKKKVDEAAASKRKASKLENEESTAASTVIDIKAARAPKRKKTGKRGGAAEE